MAERDDIIAAMLAQQGQLERNPAEPPQAWTQGVKNVIGGLAEIPKKAIGSAINYTETGEYNPAPIMDAAGLVAGGGIPFATRGAVGMAGGRLRQPAVTNITEARALKNLADWQQGSLAAVHRPALTGDALKAALAKDFDPPLPANQNVGGMLRLSKPETVAGFAPGEMFADPKLKAKAEMLRGTFPQYAEQYPSAGRGVPTLDKATGKPFMTKADVPETDAFANARSIIQKDMDVHGYEPFFDPAKRFHADPSKYPPMLDTAQHLPKKMETVLKWTNELDTPETRAALQRMYKVGQTVEGAENWYMMGQLEKAYTKELGAKAGREKFRTDFAGSMAATTGGADPTANFLMGHYANFIRNRGEDFPRVTAAENKQVANFAKSQGVPYVDKKGNPINKTGDIASYALPYPIGGQYAAGNLNQYKRVFDEVAAGKDIAKALDDANPKRLDFMQSFTGHPHGFVWDKQMTTGATAGKYDMPPSYGVMEKMARGEAAKAGVPAQNFQDVGWAGQKAMLEGAKPLTGGFHGPSGVHNYQYEGPMINHINASIERTHRLTGMPREEIVRRGLVRGEIPMYTRGGLPVSGLAAQDEYGR